MFISNDYSLSASASLIILVIIYLRNKKQKKILDLIDYVFMYIIITIVIYSTLYIKDNLLTKESVYSSNVSIAEPDF